VFDYAVHPAFRGDGLNRVNKNFLIDAAILMAGTTLTWAFAVLAKSAVIVDGNYLPYGVDSFYHAQRVLHAAMSDGVVQQFDPTMHLPEGSWVPWPWGFDRLLVAIVQTAAWLNPGVDPMRVLIYVPMAWVPINIGLLLGIFRALGQRPEFRALGIAGFALLPLTQQLHGIGMIDHHFVELTFVLLVTLFVLLWMARPSSIALAATSGAVLGIAQVFHHGLFILQVPVLFIIFVLWLRSASPPRIAVHAMAASLLATTALLVLPSEPLWDGQFSMATFSWFHVYVASCTAVLSIFMSYRAYSPRSLIALAATGAILAIPASAEILLGTKFVSGQLMMLDRIIEMASPLRMVMDNWGLAATLGLYSGLLVLVPVLLLAGAYLLVTEKRPLHIAFGVLSVFGLGLLLMQYRLNYFGLCFMLAGPLYLLSRYSPTTSSKRGIVFLVSLLAFAVVYQLPLSGPLLRQHPVGGDHLYEQSRSLFPALQVACAEQPGTVAAAAQFGHYIRFHTNCGVIANNFLLTEQHFNKVRLANSLFQLSVNDLRAQQPQVRYVFAFLANTHEQQGNKVYLRDIDDIRSGNPTLINELMLSDIPNDNVEVLGEVIFNSAGERKTPLAGVYRITD
jgi:hypothetical protein